MSNQGQKSWISEATDTLRTLKDCWVGRRGSELGDLPSDERNAINFRRTDALYIASSLLIEAFVDHNLRPNGHFLPMVDYAHRTRESQRTKKSGGGGEDAAARGVTDGHSTFVGNPDVKSGCATDMRTRRLAGVAERECKMGSAPLCVAANQERAWGWIRRLQWLEVERR